MVDPGRDGDAGWGARGYFRPSSSLGSSLPNNLDVGMGLSRDLRKRTSTHWTDTCLYSTERLLEIEVWILLGSIITLANAAKCWCPSGGALWYATWLHRPGPARVQDSIPDHFGRLCDVCGGNIYQLFSVSFHQVGHSNQVTTTTGVVAEWLSRKTRNLVPSGAQVSSNWSTVAVQDSNPFLGSNPAYVAMWFSFWSDESQHEHFFAKLKYS